MLPYCRPVLKVDSTKPCMEKTISKALKTSLWLIHPPIQFLTATIFVLPHNFSFSKSHFIWITEPLKWFLSLTKIYLRFSYIFSTIYFHALIAHIILSLNNITLAEYIRDYSFPSLQLTCLNIICKTSESNCYTCVGWFWCGCQTLNLVLIVSHHCNKNYLTKVS